MQIQHYGFMFCRSLMSMELVSISLLLFWIPLDFQSIWYHLVQVPRFLDQEILYIL